MKEKQLRGHPVPNAYRSPHTPFACTGLYTDACMARAFRSVTGAHKKGYYCTAVQDWMVVGKETIRKTRKMTIKFYSRLSP